VHAENIGMIFGTLSAAAILKFPISPNEKQNGQDQPLITTARLAFSC
jgi:hypothetical protein